MDQKVILQMIKSPMKMLINYDARGLKYNLTMKMTQTLILKDLITRKMNNKHGKMQIQLAWN